MHLIRNFGFVITLLCMSHRPSEAADLSQLLDPNASILMRISLERFEPAKVVQTLKPIVDERRLQHLLPAQMLIAGVSQSLRAAAVTEIYASFATQDLSQGFPAFIIPTTQPDRVKEVVQPLLGMVPKSFNLQLYDHSLGLIVAHPHTWERMSSQMLVQASGLRSHYQNSNNSTLSITVGFNQDVKQAVGDIWPDQLPAAIGLELSPRQLMRDIEAVSLACDAVEELSLSAVVACTDPVAARRVLAVVQPSAQKLGMTLQHDQAALTAHLDAAKLRSLIGQVFQTANLSATQMQVSNNLKQIMLAMHNFYADYNALPPRMTVDTQGRELLSWRVFLLPYLEHGALYEQFHLDEPWDSPHNRTLIEKMPSVYADLEGRNVAPGQTRVQVVLTEGAAWFGNQNRSLDFSDISDGTSSTISVVVAPADKSVIWSQPADLKPSSENDSNDDIIEQIFAGREQLPAAYFDGSVRPLPRMDAHRLPALLTGNGGETEDSGGK